MINKKKKYIMLTSLVLVVLGIVSALGFSAVHLVQKSQVRQTEHSSAQKTSSSKKEEIKEGETENEVTKGPLSTLNSEEITAFLEAYYTKKDLGENQSRYQSFMTPALYSTVVEQEEDPVALRLKGLVINQKYTSSEIYIDQENKQAICKVYYSNENLDHLPTTASPDSERYTMKNNQNIALSFKETDKGYLVDTLSYLTLGENTDGK